MSDESEVHDGYQLLVSFPDQSPTFCHGFEAGKLWAEMRGGLSAEIETTTRVENREVILRMATAEGWEVRRTPSSVDGWDLTSMQKYGPASDTPNPHGLRVVR